MTSTDDFTSRIGLDGRVARRGDGTVSPAHATGAGRDTLRRLAQEFEASLLNEMLAGWRQALVSEDEESGSKSGLLADMVGTELGRAIGRSGGFGIADVLIRELKRQYGSGDAGESPRAAGDEIRVAAARPASRVPVFSAPVEAVVTPIAERSTMPARPASVPDRVASAAVARDTPRPAGGGEDVDARPVAAVVTSGYGWRTDPFNGRLKFHSGADVRMAYGQAVSSVAAGRVTFAGDRAGYGLMVVVDHGDGRETRYAHLSSAAVRVGDIVGKGAVIARAGSSGRSTGPHLHVELFKNGRPIDPSDLLSGSTPEAGSRW